MEKTKGKEKGWPACLELNNRYFNTGNVEYLIEATEAAGECWRRSLKTDRLEACPTEAKADRLEDESSQADKSMQDISPVPALQMVVIDPRGHLQRSFLKALEKGGVVNSRNEKNLYEYKGKLFRVEYKGRCFGPYDLESETGAVSEQKRENVQV